MGKAHLGQIIANWVKSQKLVDLIELIVVIMLMM